MTLCQEMSKIFAKNYPSQCEKSGILKIKDPFKNKTTTEAPHL